MKGLIIENEYEVDGYIQCFLKDNPRLFESIQEELYCLHRGTESLLPEVLKNDAIIVSSTWMYKDQLDEFLDAFLNPKFPKKMIFFVHWITRTINEWKNDSIWTTESQDRFNKIKKLIQSGNTIYDFSEDYDYKGPKIMDGLDGYSSKYGRDKYGYWEVKYSKKYDLFYTKVDNLKYQRDEETKKLGRDSR